jgi:hypothetical protein
MIVGPGISADDTELLFNDSGGAVFHLYRSTRASAADPWSAPTIVPELASINAGWPALSGDGLEMYFETGSGPDQLYVVTRPSRSQPFGVPRPLTEIGDANADEGDPWISRDGQTFLFSSTRTGQGLSDVFMTTRTCR